MNEFNEKYNQNINENDFKINFYDGNYDNQLIEDLTKIELNNLKDLALGGNDITDLTSLKNAKFKNLEFLSINKFNIRYKSIMSSKF